MRYKISANVIRRLPRYLRRLELMDRQGTEKTSSGDLGARMGLTASQIRQDLNCFGGFGQQGYGYNVKQLREGIASVLGVDRTMTAVVIGAGNLGRALIANFNFSECGFDLIAAFDVDPSRVGTVISGTTVLHGDTLEEFLSRRRPDVAVLTLTRSRAQEIASLCASKGVRGIWNFTGADLDDDLHGAIVENVHLSDSLLTLGFYLRGQGESDDSKEAK